MDTTDSILRFAKRFLAGTVLSRLSGVGRDVVMAICFGSAPEVAAFMVAYRLANLFRRLLGEGNLQAGFVPHFEALSGKDPREALLFYRDISFSLLFVLLGTVLGLEGIFWITSFSVTPEWAHLIHLAMWMTPGLLFICLYALNSAFLQCHRSYFSPAVAPVLFNVAWILIALWASHFPLTNAIQFLSMGITLAFAMQWRLTASQVRKKLSLSSHEWLRPRLFSPEWKKLLKPLSLGILGIGAMQINSALDAIFARLADPSGPAYLWYAIRVQQLPLSIFGIALSGALLPPLARAIREGAMERYQHLLENSLRYSACLMIFCTFGIFGLGQQGLNLLYGHGGFTPADVSHTLLCLWGYGAGLLPAVFVLLLASGFYARKKYTLPTMASLGTVLLNVGFNVWMVFGLKWGAPSIAIATSIASCVNCVFLAVALRKEIGTIFSGSFWRLMVRLTVSGAVAALSAQMAPSWMEELPRSFLDQIVQLSFSGAIFLTVFLGAAYMLGIKEFFDLFRKSQEA